MMKHEYFFHFDVISKIMKAMDASKDQVSLSLDLNLTQKSWPIKDGCLVLNPDLCLEKETLRAIETAKNKIFVLNNSKMTPLEVRNQGYYKLVPTDSAPTLEIDGIKMHRSKDIDPLTDAKLKTRLVVSPRDQVLDTCGGLGYSSMFALKAGARKVISFEKSRAVITLRESNPWLAEFTDEKLVLRHGDITREIEQLEDQRFNSVIHDPPRFTSATGDLYGKKFYSGLFRVMKKGAKLFHYTGSPKKIKTQDKFIKNTIKRLETAGFDHLEFNDHLQGIYGRKN